ncbi:hypothetical protein BS78_03G204300 [Paspalum vaginatum]|nr:hypothetical protein BS78_03G204300 [Paspalum vaginatum]
MAGGSKSKVREWMRRRMSPRRTKASGSGSDSSSSSESAPMTAASAQSSPTPRRKLLAGALRWRKPRGNVLAALFGWAAYHLLWLVESVVVVARLCFFFLRFGFRL